MSSGSFSFRACCFVAVLTLMGVVMGRAAFASSYSSTYMKAVRLAKAGDTARAYELMLQLEKKGKLDARQRYFLACLAVTQGDKPKALFLCAGLVKDGGVFASKAQALRAAILSSVRTRRSVEEGSVIRMVAYPRSLELASSFIEKGLANVVSQVRRIKAGEAPPVRVEAVPLPNVGVEALRRGYEFEVAARGRLGSMFGGTANQPGGALSAVDVAAVVSSSQAGVGVEEGGPARSARTAAAAEKQGRESLSPGTSVSSAGGNVGGPAAAGASEGEMASGAGGGGKESSIPPLFVEAPSSAAASSSAASGGKSRVSGGSGSKAEGRTAVARKKSSSASSHRGSSAAAARVKPPKKRPAVAARKPADEGDEDEDFAFDDEEEDDTGANADTSTRTSASKPVPAGKPKAGASSPAAGKPAVGGGKAAPSKVSSPAPKKGGKAVKVSPAGEDEEEDDFSFDDEAEDDGESDEGDDDFDF